MPLPGELGILKGQADKLQNAATKAQQVSAQIAEGTFKTPSLDLDTATGLDYIRQADRISAVAERLVEKAEPEVGQRLDTTQAVIRIGERAQKGLIPSPIFDRSRQILREEYTTHKVDDARRQLDAEKRAKTKPRNNQRNSEGSSHTNERKPHEELTEPVLIVMCESERTIRINGHMRKFREADGGKINASYEIFKLFSAKNGHVTRGEMGDLPIEKGKLSALITNLKINLETTARVNGLVTYTDEIYNLHGKFVHVDTLEELHAYSEPHSNGEIFSANTQPELATAK